MSNSASEMTITPSETKKVKLNESESKDRLSDLTDCVILHILSFLNAKHAVQTCVLSPRYKDIWKRLPALTLHSTDFQTYKKFSEFVSRVLSLRDSSISLHALDFKRDVGRLAPRILKMIVDYAISHNVKWLGLFVVGDIAQIPPSLFSCHTLTHLKLCIYVKGGHAPLFPKSFNLPALTSLQLQNFEFCVGDNDRAEPFSTFTRLKSLLISNCTVSGARILCISSVTLVNLTIYHMCFDYSNHTIELCTSSLCTFAFTGTPSMKLSGRDVSSLKHVEIYANENSCRMEPPLFLFRWLLEFPNIKSLTVSATTLQVLYLFPDLLKTDLPSLGNLNSLKVEMEPISYAFRMTMKSLLLRKSQSKKEAAKLRRAFKEGLEPFSLTPDGIMHFLLQNSPSAKVDIIDCSRQPPRLAYL